MRTRRSLISFLSVSALAVGSLSIGVLAPSAQAATLSVGSVASPIDCGNLATGTSSQTLSSALATGDTLQFVYDDCNNYYLFWTNSDFTTSFGSSGVKENGNNTETRVFSNYQGSASTGTVLVTLANASSLASATKKFEIKQGSAAWTAKAPPDGVVGTSYESGTSGYQFTAPNGTGDYSVTSGSLPTGLSLSVTGVLSGTPTRLGTYTFAVSRVGESATTGDISMTITSPAVDKVTICHRTRATTNPYVMITVSVDSIIRSSGHSEHNTTRTNKENPRTGTTTGSGPFDTTYTYPANKKWWGDIIPPFTHSGGTYAGLNWGPDWATPNPTGSGVASKNDWLEPVEFKDAVSGTNDIYRQAVALCLDLSTGSQSTQSAAIDTPENFFKVSVDNGEDPDSVREDLTEQEALNPTNPVVGSPEPIPTITSLETTYNSTAAVETDPASKISRTSATLNGELKTGSTWNSWKYEWATTSAAIGNGSATSYTYTPGTDNANSIGGGPRTPEHEITGLTCNTTYYFRVVGTDSSSNTKYGLVRSFTTSTCASSGGGGNNGNGNGGGGGGNGPGGGTSSTPSSTPGNSPGRVPGSGRPQQVSLPPAARPTTPGGGSTNRPNGPTPGGSPSSGSSGSSPNGSTPTPGTTTTTTPPRPDRPRDLTPTVAVPPPPGDEWVPENLRLQDPDSGVTTLRVVDNQGTWVVNPTTGTVTFTPAPDFVGTAVLNVQLVARSGAIEIHPVRVRVASTARILVVKGDVPRDISGGVARRR